MSARVKRVNADNRYRNNKRKRATKRQISSQQPHTTTSYTMFAEAERIVAFVAPIHNIIDSLLLRPGELLSTLHLRVDILQLLCALVLLLLFAWGKQ